MPKLNKTNGDLSFGDLTINRSLKIFDRLALQANYKVTLNIVNAEYTTLILRNLEDGNFSASLTFFNEELQTVNIELGTNFNFEPFVITAEEKTIVREQLIAMGGSGSYSWGDVSFNEDMKGGNVGILITYH